MNGTMMNSTTRSKRKAGMNNMSTSTRIMPNIAKRILSLTLFFLCGVSTLVAQVPIPGARQSKPILLKGGDLYTVSQGVLSETDVLFDQGRITQIGKNLSVPSNAEIIDITGKRVYPGLIAPNTQIGLIEIGAVRATNDLNEVGDMTPEALAHVGYNPDNQIGPTIRTNGITTLQVMPEGGTIPGRSFVANLDAWNKEDAAVKLVDGLVINWPSPRLQDGPNARPVEEQKKQMLAERRNLRELFAATRAYRDLRASNPNAPVDLRLQSLIPVVNAQIPVYVNANLSDGIAEAVSFAADQKIKIIIVGGVESWMVAELLKENQVPVILAQTMRLPTSTDDPYDLPFSSPAKLQSAGVKFCLSRPGYWDVRNLPFEGGQAVAFGLTEDQALRALTLSTAEILGIEKDQGSLEVGKKASLVVCTGNIFDIAGNNIERMYIEGRSVELENKQTTLYKKFKERITRQ
jgi:imidazolonepropionase-like amidohydrolase